MNEPVSDMELERFLRRRDRLSQEYAALGSDGPSADMDARVLELARRALDEDARSPFWRRANWPRITALAATVVLSFALVVRLAIDNETPTQASAPVAMENATMASDAAPALAGEAAQTPPPRDDVRRGGPPDGAQSVPLEILAPAPAPPSMDMEVEAAAPQAMTAQTQTLRSAPMSPPGDAVAQAPGSESSLLVENSSEIVSTSPLQKHEADSLPLSDEARQRLERREAALAKRAQEPADRELPVQEEKAAAVAGPRANRPPEDETHVEPTRSEGATQGFVVTRSSIARPHPEDVKRDPQEWFEQILRLRADGRTEEADREIEKLRAAHPDFKPAQEPQSTR